MGLGWKHTTCNIKGCKGSFKLRRKMRKRAVMKRRKKRRGVKKKLEFQGGKGRAALGLQFQAVEGADRTLWAASMSFLCRIWSHKILVNLVSAYCIVLIKL